MTSFYQTKKKTKLRLQKHNNHWITKGIKKPSKRKQKFYKKLKNWEILQNLHKSFGIY